MSFTTEARNDLSNLLTAHGITVTVRTRTASTYDGDDQITYSTSDASATAIWVPNVGDKELYELSGIEDTADAKIQLAYDTSIDINDQIYMTPKHMM